METQIGVGRRVECGHCGEMVRSIELCEVPPQGGMRTNVYGKPVTGRVLVEHLQPARVLTPQGKKVAGYLIHECTSVG